MRFMTIIWTSACLVAISVALPVTKNKGSSSTEKPATQQGEEDLGAVLEYERYLREVVEALESDDQFRKKLDKAPEADIRSGKIAQELEYVNHHVRSKLDEIKRREIERLRSFASKQYELSNDIDRERLKIGDHVQHENEHTFEIEDLRKLILKTSADLAEADRQRREEFKQYEMQKEFENQQVLENLDEDHKKKYEDEVKEKKEKHNKHEKVHHPGNRAQLEEVWDKQDHMEGQEFNPEIFFKLHDLDGNGFWDENELKALFVKELDKVYKEGLPEDDMRERAEDMERMREHVFKESDTNHDGLISYQEFLDQTKRDEFNRDPGWDTVDNVPQYTHEEYLEFERRRQEEIQRLVAQGHLPPHPNMPHGYYPNGQPHPNQQQLHYQQQPQFHQQQMHHQQQQQQHEVYQQQQQYHAQQQQHAGQQQQHPGQQQQHPGQQQQNQQQFQQQQQHPNAQLQQQQQQYQQPQGQQQQYNQQPVQQVQQQNQQPPAQQQQYQKPPTQQPYQQPPVQQAQQQNQQPPAQQQQYQQPPPAQQQQYQQPPPAQPQQPQQPPPAQLQQPQQPPPAQQQYQQPSQNQPASQQINQHAQPVAGQKPVSNQQQPTGHVGGNVANVNAIPADTKHQQQFGKHN